MEQCVNYANFKDAIPQSNFDLGKGVIALERYFTKIPISPLSYRKDNPTNAQASVRKRKDRVIFILVDDHCGSYHISILLNKNTKDFIQKNVKSLEKEELLPKDSFTL